MHSRVISYFLFCIGNHLPNICRQFYYTIAVIVDARVVIRCWEHTPKSEVSFMSVLFMHADPKWNPGLCTLNQCLSVVYTQTNPHTAFYANWRNCSMCKNLSLVIVLCTIKSTILRTCKGHVELLLWFLSMVHDMIYIQSQCGNCKV
jgi:hypothetical protein